MKKLKEFITDKANIAKKKKVKQSSVKRRGKENINMNNKMAKGTGGRFEEYIWGYESDFFGSCNRPSCWPCRPNVWTEGEPYG